MKTFSKILLLMAALLCASAVQARDQVIERPNIPVVTGSGKSVNQEELTRAIINGAAAGKRKWEVVPAGDGKSLKALYKVRAHAVWLNIVPGPDSYSIQYADSVGMKYRLDNGTPLIHGNYNKWVEELIDSITVELKNF
jgi:hypothetical protein